jgi:predicted alpha/beta-fold hydrolase
MRCSWTQKLPAGAGVPLTNARIYSAATIEDISTALLYLSATYPKARLLGVGFSLGANVLTRYLAETGTKSRLASGCVLACVRIPISQQTHLMTACSPGILVKIVKGMVVVSTSF